MECLLNLSEAVMTELVRLENDALALARRLELARKKVGQKDFVYKVSIRGFAQEHNVSSSSADLAKAVTLAIERYRQINRRNDIWGAWTVVAQIEDGIEIPLPEELWVHLKPTA